MIGSGNVRKLEHYKRYLSDLPIALLTPADLGITEEPQETGKTFEENAVLKANYYFEKTGIPTLADDGGFEILTLNGFPGVKSRRFVGHDMNDNEIINGVLDAMKDLPENQRQARMTMCCSLRLDADHLFTASGSIDGTVPETSFDKRMERFPYRSLLYIDSLNKWFYNLTDADEDTIGYRKAAVEQLKKYLIDQE